MNVTLNGETVATANDEDIIPIEGNPYIPRQSVAEGVRLEVSDTQYTCPWKGPATYWNVVVGDTTIADGAWSYDDLLDNAIERVGSDFTGHLVFDRSKLEVE